MGQFFWVFLALWTSTCSFPDWQVIQVVNLCLSIGAQTSDPVLPRFTNSEHCFLQALQCWLWLLQLTQLCVGISCASCEFIYTSPDRPNIFYSVKQRTTISTDVHIVDDLRNNSITATRVIIYCKSLNMCADLYAHFLYELGSLSYYPPSWCRRGCK